MAVTRGVWLAIATMMLTVAVVSRTVSSEPLDGSAVSDQCLLMTAH